MPALFIERDVSGATVTLCGLGERGHLPYNPFTAILSPKKFHGRARNPGPCREFLVVIDGPSAPCCALVIGQSAYPGGASASVGLKKLANPVVDARRMAALLAQHGFEVISCNGKDPDCFDLNRDAFLDALARLEAQAEDADLALVYFAGHGVATEEGMRGRLHDPFHQ